MKKKFSTYVDILERDNINQVMKASKSDFAYMLKEFAAWKDLSPEEKRQRLKYQGKTGSEKELQQAEAPAPYTPQQRAQALARGEGDPGSVNPETAPYTGEPPAEEVPPEEVPPEEVPPEVAPPEEAPPEEAPPEEAPPVPKVPAGTPVANAPAPKRGLVGKTVDAIGKGMNYLASGQTTGDDPHQLSAAMKTIGDPNSQQVIDNLIADLPGIRSNPAVGERLLNILQQKSGAKITEGASKFDEGWMDSLKQLGSRALSGVGKAYNTVKTKGPGMAKTLGQAITNVHQATGGKYGTQKSDMLGIATGDLQRRNMMKANYHDFLKTALNRPEALDDHPTWVDFMQSATPAQKQAFVDYVNQSVQQQTQQP